MQTFTPLKLGSLVLANRLVRSATGEGAATEDVGQPTDAMAAFYGRLASGGAGLIVTGHIGVSHSGRCRNVMTAATSDRFVPAFKRIVDTCHEHDVPVVAQLNHGGRQSDPSYPGIRALCPSPVRARGSRIIPEELTEPEILQIISDFGRAARRCRDAGADGVQIHAAHGYLVSQFNSPLTNRRTDRWGGSHRKRKEFMTEVYRAIRGELGDTFPVLVKQNCSDFHPNGLSEEQALDICRTWNELGITCIELSGGIRETISTAFRAEEIKASYESVFFESQAEVIRRSVDCPIILTGGIRTLGTCERLLHKGTCEGVGLCRPFIREPDLPKNWLSGTSTQATCTTCGACKSSPERCNYCALREWTA